MGGDRLKELSGCCKVGAVNPRWMCSLRVNGNVTDSQLRGNIDSFDLVLGST